MRATAQKIQKSPEIKSVYQNKGSYQGTFITIAESHPHKKSCLQFCRMKKTLFNKIKHTLQIIRTSIATIESLERQLAVQFSSEMLHVPKIHN